jgi:23S rRNA (uracil-5-)-methyltransferase RumA
MQKHNLTPWNNRDYTGFLRYLVIREGKYTGKRMITIITSQGELPSHPELIAALKPFANTIYHGINPTVTDLSQADELTLLYGEPLLEEQVAGNTFSIHPNAFFQTNTLMAEQLVHKAKEYLAEKPPTILLDLYCGTGLFGISLAPQATRVFGVEIEPKAIEMAKHNATRNNITNIDFVAGKAEDLALWDQETPDTVIIDPPRAGLHPKVIKLLLEKSPERILAISCNYESFARDWQHFAPHYEITKLDALDLFPHTAHVELITLLEKTKK